MKESLVPILLFDGSCGLCNASVQFILRHEKKKIIYFASLQSEFALQALKKSANNFVVIPDSILLFHQGRLYVKSQAIFQIIQMMGGWVTIFLAFRFFPRRWLDFLYDFIARKRKGFFGISTYCAFKPGVDQGRFLDV